MKCLLSLLLTFGLAFNALAHPAKANPGPQEHEVIMVNGQRIQLPHADPHYIEVHQVNNGQTDRIEIKSKDRKTGKVISKTYTIPAKQNGRSQSSFVEMNSTGPINKKALKHFREQQRHIDQAFAEQQHAMQQQIRAMNQQITLDQQQFSQAEPQIIEQPPAPAPKQHSWWQYLWHKIKH